MARLQRRSWEASRQAYLARERPKFMQAFEAAAVATCPALAGRIDWTAAEHYWHATGAHVLSAAECGRAYATRHMEDHNGRS